MDEEDLEVYDEPGITSADRRVPLFLKWTYIFFPLWGILWFALFWNGNIAGGWFDRGYWHQLQIAANTTLPNENQNMPEHPHWDAYLGEEENLQSYLSL